MLRNEKYSIQELNDLTYVAYSLVLIDEKTGKKEYPDNSMDLLSEMGFNKKYKPLIIRVPATKEGLDIIYNTFKEYREQSNYFIDGIVLKYKESLRNKLGENSHEPKWALAVKFVSPEVFTYIIDIEWSIGTNGELTPTAILEKIELLGTMVQRASLSNLGNMIKKRLFIGSLVKIKKSGEIIPFITGLVEPSPYEEEYMEQLRERLIEFNITI